MSSSKVENLIRQSLDELYIQRSIKLTGVMLSDLLSKKNLYLLCATNGSSASKIVEKMLSEYIASSDESIFGDTFFRSIARIENESTRSTGDESNIIYKAIAIIDHFRDYPTQSRLEFIHTWANTLNRFEHDFLNNFGNADGTIDWEKLLRYNSGKENVPWISKVMPASVEDLEEDEAEESDDSIEGYG